MTQEELTELADIDVPKILLQPEYRGKDWGDIAYKLAVDCFIRGYRKAEPKWISIEDRLPEVYPIDTFLIYGEVRFERPGSTLAYGKTGMADYDGRRWVLPSDEYIHITHWQPLPHQLFE